jgi:hypothetical protein
MALMMTQSWLFRFMALTLLLMVSHAHAAQQTWRVTGTIYLAQGGGFVPPAFANVGQTLAIDYVFDTSVFTSKDIVFNNPVTSVTFNGESSLMNSYLLNWDTFYAINGTPTPWRKDGVNFLSWNLYAQQSMAATTMADFLKHYAQPSTAFSDLRIDFGANSVWLEPTSFVMISSVPEPHTKPMIFLGIIVISLFSIKRSRV